MKRQAAEVLREEHELWITRACGLIGISRCLYGCRGRQPDSGKLRERIGELAGKMRRYAYQRIHVLLRREDWTVNRKRTYRLYREAGRKRPSITP